MASQQSKESYIGIGTQHPQVPLDIQSACTTDLPHFGYLNKNDDPGFNTTSTSVYAQGNIITGNQFETLSDSRLKKNISPLNSHQQIQFIKQLKPVRFQLKKEKQSKKSGPCAKAQVQIGFLAQDVIKTGINYDELVNMRKNSQLRSFQDQDGFISHDKTEYSLNYDAFSPIIVSVLQELLASNQKLSADLFDLKTQFQIFKRNHQFS